MRTRIGLLAPPESMRSISWRHSVRAAARLSLKLLREKVAFLQPSHSQPNPTPSLRSALSEPEWPQQANSCITTCKTTCLQRRAGVRARGGVESVLHPFQRYKLKISASHLKASLL